MEGNRSFPQFLICLTFHNSVVKSAQLVPLTHHYEGLPVKAAWDNDRLGGPARDEPHHSLDVMALHLEMVLDLNLGFEPWTFRWSLNDACVTSFPCLGLHPRSAGCWILLNLEEVFLSLRLYAPRRGFSEKMASCPRPGSDPISGRCGGGFSAAAATRGCETRASSAHAHSKQPFSEETTAERNCMYGNFTRQEAVSAFSSEHAHLGGTQAPLRMRWTLEKLQP